MPAAVIARRNCPSRSRVLLSAMSRTSLSNGNTCSIELHPSRSQGGVEGNGSSRAHDTVCRKGEGSVKQDERVHHRSGAQRVKGGGDGKSYQVGGDSCRTTPRRGRRGQKPGLPPLRP